MQIESGQSATIPAPATVAMRLSSIGPRDVIRNRTRKAAAVGLIALAALLCGREILRGPRSAFAKFDLKMDRAYESVRMGTPKAEVLTVLGQAIRVEPTFCLPQRHGFEGQFEEADRSTSTEYYLWLNGVNWYYCIGFDRNGKVSMKGQGHS